MAELLAYALCSVADVKESLGIPSSDTSKDNLITRKINQATLMIEKYTGRRFKQTTYTDEEYDGSGIDSLVLNQRPISAVSISQRDTALNEGDWDLIDSELYFLDSEAGVVELNFHAVGNWNRYKVTYTAGYSPIPSDLAEAAATLAAFLVESGYSGSNVKSKQQGGQKIEYFDNKSSTKGSDIFDEINIAMIVDSYANSPLGAA